MPLVRLRASGGEPTLGKSPDDTLDVERRSKTRQKEKRPLKPEATAMGEPRANASCANPWHGVEAAAAEHGPV